MEASTIEHFDWRAIINVSADIEPATVAALDRYFSKYAKPPMSMGADGKVLMEEMRCLKCDSLQTGMSSLLLGGGFQWGLVHGEGHCGKCGWPATLYHFVKDADGKELMTLRGILLQYHPDVVELRIKAVA